MWKESYLHEVMMDGESPYPDTSGSGFEDDDDHWSYVSPSVRAGQSKLAQLQQALPRRCRLTNTGRHRGHMKPWGEAESELPAWHVWKANLFKDMDSGLNTLRGASAGLTRRRHSAHGSLPCWRAAVGSSPGDTGRPKVGRR